MAKDPVGGVKNVSLENGVKRLSVNSCCFALLGPNASFSQITTSFYHIVGISALPDYGAIQIIEYG